MTENAAGRFPAAAEAAERDQHQSATALESGGVPGVGVVDSGGVEPDETAKGDTVVPEEEDDEADDEELLGLMAGHKKEISTKVKLTEEEMQLPPAERAAVLQRKIRDYRLAKEKEEAYQAERNRIASQKALQESRLKLEELEAVRIRELLEKEKREKKDAEDRQRELLRLEYRDRFGRDLDEAAVAEAALAKKSSREQIKHWVGRLALIASKNCAGSSAGEGADIGRCVKTLIAYCENAAANPLAPKFLAISKTNKAFVERITPFPDAVKLLGAVGFKDDGEHYRISGYPNTLALNQSADLLKHVLKSL